ncbi:hypothetical protein [Paenibacillus piscarius]|uniref:hypothetical protein n=1 Tax=Paenibacillus piscarius TaxID=1089681 RepID=UPI001EE992B3|nr:hypothetical protein [Paenibacillus piscarius]
MVKKRFKIEFISVAMPDQSEAIVKQLVRLEMHKLMHQHGVISTNLDEVMDKYITTVLADEQ